MSKDNQKGVSLLLTLLIMAAFLAIAFGASKLTLGEIKLVRDIPKSLIAYYAADSGVEEAIYKYRIQGQTEDFNGCLDSEICYRVVFSGASPNIIIKSSGTYKDIIRAIEITY